VEQLGERYGRFQDGECQVMKQDLLRLGDDGVGRVPLSRFYKPAMDQIGFQFTESVEHLRQLGALDETNPQQSSVIIPNYISAQSNCIASSSYYSVCCMDECEKLIGHLEEKIASPQAPSSNIVSLVSLLPSSTVEAPRVLSPLLVQRLDQIADSHGGEVPLHGRMFAQWMHHAYPRECPCPHAMNATHSRSSDGWMLTASGASVEEMEMHISSRVHVGNISALHWSHEEELLAPLQTFAAASRPVSMLSVLRILMFLSAAVAVLINTKSFTKTASAAYFSSSVCKAEKFL